MGSMSVRRKGGVIVAALAGASVFAFTAPVAQARPLVQGILCDPEFEECDVIAIGDLWIEKHVDGSTSPTPGFDLVAIPIRLDATVADGNGNDTGIFLSEDDATSLTLSAEFLDGDTPELDVFIGEVLREGFVFDDLDCENVSDIDSQLEFRSDTDQLGRVFRLPLGAEFPPECVVDNLSATIDLTKTVAPTSVAPGANVVFTITVRNTGFSTLYDGVLQDVLPSGMTFVSAVGGAGVTCDAAAPVRCDLDDVEPSTSRTVTVTATVGAGVADAAALTNAASVEAIAPYWNPDLCISNQPDGRTFDLLVADPVVAGECGDVPAFFVRDRAAATVTAVVPTTSTTSTTTTTVAPTTTALGVQPPAPTTLPPIADILPETGGNETNLAIVAASAVVLGGLLLLVRRRRPGHA